MNKWSYIEIKLINSFRIQSEETGKISLATLIVLNEQTLVR